MGIVAVTVTFDQAAGTAKFAMDLQGVTELEHEILLATIGSGRDVKITPAHIGNELFAEFTVTDPAIWPRAIRALTNRKRVADGLPTIEAENFKRKGQGLPTIEEEAVLNSQAALDQENERRKYAGLASVEEDEDARNHQAFLDKNDKLKALGYPLVSEEDYAKSVSDRKAKKEKDAKDAIDAAHACDEEYAAAHEALNPPPPPPPTPMHQKAPGAQMPDRRKGLAPDSGLRRRSTDVPDALHNLHTASEHA
jgi:hypothetical protein